MMRMLRKNIRLVLAVVFTLAALILLGWSLWPAGRSVRRQPIRPADMRVAVGGGSLPETRVLTLDVPQAIRTGDADVVRLTLAMDSEKQGGGTPPLQGAGLSANAYDSYNVLAEARLDMSGAAVLPAGAVSEALLPGKSVVFLWNVRQTEQGASNGTVWLFLRFIPRNGGAEIRQPLSAQGVEIGTSALFGIKTGVARWLGVAGTFVSTLLGLPFLVSGASRLSRRRKKGL